MFNDLRAGPGSVALIEGEQRLIDNAVQSLGRLDILINNAGIFRIDEIQHVTEEDRDPRPLRNHEPSASADYRER